MLTVDSKDDNVDAAGNTRVDIQSAGQNALTAVQGITQTIAQGIVASRGQRQFQSIADLLDVTGQANQGNNRLGGGAANGSTLIDHDLLMQIADYLTVGSDSGKIRIDQYQHRVARSAGMSSGI